MFPGTEPTKETLGSDRVGGTLYQIAAYDSWKLRWGTMRHVGTCYEAGRDQGVPINKKLPKAYPQYATVLHVLQIGGRFNNYIYILRSARGCMHGCPSFLTLTIHFCKVGILLVEQDEEPAVSRLATDHPVIVEGPCYGLPLINAVVLGIDLHTAQTEGVWGNGF